MKKVAISLVVLLLAGIIFASSIMFSTVGVLFAANAATNPCISPIGTVPVIGGPVRVPLAGPFTTTSEYGMRVHPITGEYVLHAGIDLVVSPANGPVVAAKAGVVRGLPTTIGGGRQVEVDHGAGLVTVYKHLDTRTVEVGETVWAGKQVGTQGTTGGSTGNHLHFEVHQSGIPTDPRPWLAANGVTVPAVGGQGVAPPVVTEDPGDLPVLTPEPSPVTPPPGDPGPTNPVTGDLPEQVGPYQGQEVVNAAYIIKAGQALDLDAQSITIGVMTAMGESGLVNLDHGDEAGPDSRGLFQQRDNGAWGSYEDRMNPTIASTNFFNALVQVPGYLELEPTIAAHRTQRNADPYHYRPYWGFAVEMVSVLTEDPTLLERLPAPGGLVDGCGDLPDPPPPGDGTGDAIVAAAQHYLGTPYSWGGGDITGPTLGIYTSPGLDGTNTVGFDCSGLVLFAVHNATGIQLPRTADDQGHDPRGHAVPRDFSQMLPGDVVAFSEDGSGRRGTFGHIGIYIGDGQMIHAPRPGKNVEIVQLEGSSYYEPMHWEILRFTS